MPPAACGRARGQGGCASRRPRSDPEEAVPPWRSAPPAICLPFAGHSPSFRSASRAPAARTGAWPCALWLASPFGCETHVLRALEGVAYAGHLRGCAGEPRTGSVRDRGYALGAGCLHPASIRPCSRETCPAGRSAGWGPRPRTLASRARSAPWSALPRLRQPAPPHASCPAAELSAPLKPGMFVRPSSAVLFAHSAAGISLKRARLSALRPPRAARLRRCSGTGRWQSPKP